jgi:hypothetical protein
MLIPNYLFSMGCDICYNFVYFDDILLTRSNSTLVQCLITLLNSEFKLCDFGVAYYFLGIEVTLTNIDHMLSQHKFILDILYRASMLSCKLVDTMVSSFFQIINALKYLTFTRSDICYAMNKV